MKCPARVLMVMISGRVLLWCLCFPFVGVAADVSTNAVEKKPPLQIVTCREGTDVEALIQEYQFVPKFRYKSINGFAAAMADSTVQSLKADPRVMFVDTDGPVQLCGETIGEGVTRIGAARFPLARINGTPKTLDVDVAVIDSGISPHPDLPPSYYWFSPFSDNPNDENGHGTLVAGIIAAVDSRFGVVGVAPGVRIWNYKAIAPPPYGAWSDVFSAMDDVIAHADRISVANMSLGNTAVLIYNTLHYLLKRMVEAGIVVVAAAGNDGHDLAGQDGEYGTSDDYVPCGDPYAMAVSAMDPFTDLFSTFSNFSQVERTNGYLIDGGPLRGTNFVTSPGGAIDVVAPGQNVVSTTNTGWYAYAHGTSMAAPHVTGLVALYIAANGRATNAEGV